MSQIVNPIGYRISVIKTWFSIVHYYVNYASDFIFIDLHIRKLIGGIFSQHKFLLSDIVIKYLPDYYIINIKFFKYNHNNSVAPLVSFLKYLLSSITGKTVYIVAIQVPSFLHSSKILAEYIQLQHAEMPKKPNLIYKNILREFNKQAEL